MLLLGRLRTVTRRDEEAAKRGLRNTYEGLLMNKTLLLNDLPPTYHLKSDRPNADYQQILPELLQPPVDETSLFVSMEDPGKLLNFMR